jgi:hypothetical protein
MKNAVFWDLTPSGSCKNDVSKERIASIIRVTRIGELGTTIAVTTMLQLLVTANVLSLSIIFSLMMEAIRSYETSVLTRAMPRNIPSFTAIYQGQLREAFCIRIFTSPRFHSQQRLPQSPI